MKKTLIIINIILFCCSTISYGWGPDGHSIVASIAQTLLTNQSLIFVRNHLPWYTTGNLSMLASWPDFIIYPDTNPVDYLNWQWSKQLHYVNTKDWSCVYDRQVDCSWNGTKTCVDGSIKNYTERLSDNSEDDVQREQALKFLVHFIGDAHQPLHAGFQGDEGGNTIKGRFFNKETNLHSIWDTGIIERRINEDFHSQPKLFLEYLINQMKTKYSVNISDWTLCSQSDESKYLACADKWIIEDSKLNCEIVYRDENNNRLTPSTSFDLGQVYYLSRLPIVEQRLIQGGLRLANVINKIVDLTNENNQIIEYNQKNIFFITFLMIILPICFLSLICVIVCTRRENNSKKVVHL